MCERGRDKEREREMQNLKQAPGSELSAQSPMQGSNQRTVTSRPELKSDALLTEPPRPPWDLLELLQFGHFHYYISLFYGQTSSYFPVLPCFSYLSCLVLACASKRCCFSFLLCLAVSLRGTAFLTVTSCPKHFACLFIATLL